MSVPMPHLLCASTRLIPREGRSGGAPNRRTRLAARMLCVRSLLCGLSLLPTGCIVESEPVTRPAPDPERFLADVYPILLDDCAFPACHGDPDRFLLIHGPGRSRLDPATLPYDPPTVEEVAFAYARASSMLETPEGDPRTSPLLRKPLAVEAGGARHGGDDRWGAPVFARKSDPRYETMFFWALTAEGDVAQRSDVEGDERSDDAQRDPRGPESR